MIAYQYKIRKEKELIGSLDFNINDVNLHKKLIKKISKSTASKIY